jgi:imidazole glycerol-phosphate synthase subunit HisH
MIHVILDYGVGNLASLQSGFKRAGLESIITQDPAIIENAISLVLPGVGAFEPAMNRLNEMGFIPLLNAHVKAGKPLLGICLGMQLLYETSLEHGTHQGLGYLKGTVEPLVIAPKIPHMGWNHLTFHKTSPLLLGILKESYVYFVHSYYAVSNEDDWVATTSHGEIIPAIVANQNVIGMQFHPEKSAHVGEQLLKNYGRWLDEHHSVDGSI